MPTSGSIPPEAPSPDEEEGATPGLVPVLEALLFASPQPLTLEMLREVLEHVEEPELRAMLGRLRADLDQAGRGVSLVEVAGGWQICSRREYASYVQKMLRGRRKARLSRAALETLAIVAYRQPVTKADIESIRGVDSSGVLAHLLERNLATIRGRARAVGRPLLYGTTQEFLVYFGLNDLSELPRPEELAALLKDREADVEMDTYVPEDEERLRGEERLPGESAPDEAALDEGALYKAPLAAGFEEGAERDAPAGTAEDELAGVARRGENAPDDLGDPAR